MLTAELMLKPEHEDSLEQKLAGGHNAIAFLRKHFIPADWPEREPVEVHHHHIREGTMPPSMTDIKNTLKCCMQS